MLILRKEAERDIKIAFDWYEEQSLNLGHEFLAEVEVKLSVIEGNPEIYEEIYGNVRRALCDRFPYSLYYINDHGDIVVIGVLHQRRSPAKWQDRL